MKILWHSVKPTIPTGYGTQTALMVKSLARAGHKVDISCTAGLFACMEMWEGIRLFPHSNHQGNYGSDSVMNHIKYLKPDLVWSWIDAFILPEATCKESNWAAWVPLDSTPLMTRNTPPLKACKWTVGPTKFACRELGAAGMANVLYVPCAFDPSQFYRRDQAEAREFFGRIIKRDLSGAFLVNAVGANIGNRKNYPAMFEGWRSFAKNHNDAILYLNTESSGVQGEGEDLIALLKLYGIQDSVLFVSQWHYLTGQFGNDYLNLLYNASDLHLNTCLGEGFGLPIMDAQACGCPTAVPDFAAAGEIGFCHKMKKGRFLPTVPGAFQFSVDPAAVTEALEEAYENKGDVDYRKQIADRADEYSIDYVMAKYMLPVLEQIEKEICL